MIDEAHGVAAEEGTIADLVAAISSRVVVFEALGRSMAFMEKG